MKSLYSEILPELWMVLKKDDKGKSKEWREIERKKSRQFKIIFLFIHLYRKLTLLSDTPEEDVTIT